MLSGRLLTLYDMSCLLHLPIEVRLLDHTTSLTKDEGALLTMTLLGVEPVDVDMQVTETRGV
ncbi:hypothetical protein TSUD_228500 [Trifolium subterraneum]|uniref:Uncharacterized protein n=1 Tax=Trifolium subterraneum TaxID=3900 RepID=A0A2Z6M1P9_TRISU|nr:hypothetical protein TSUD_228500 [Trifolium subterraneum]